MWICFNEIKLFLFCRISWAAHQSLHVAPGIPESLVSNHCFRKHWQLKTLSQNTFSCIQSRQLSSPASKSNTSLLKKKRSLGEWAMLAVHPWECLTSHLLDFLFIPCWTFSFHLSGPALLKELQWCQLTLPHYTVWLFESKWAEGLLWRVYLRKPALYWWWEIQHSLPKA